METLGQLPGNRDPRGTAVTYRSLIEFASRRGEAPIFLDQMIDDQADGPVSSPPFKPASKSALERDRFDLVTHGGGPGRPSAMPLIIEEARRRAAAGTLAKSRNKEADALHKWCKAAHPDVPAPVPKTIANNLSASGLYRDLKKSGPN